jgi:hypothetical protein
MYFHKFSHILSSSWKTKNLIDLLYDPLKSWPKNLSNEYIYAEQNPNRTRDICFQSWACRSQSRLTISTKFWLWWLVPRMWQVTRGVIVWLFLSWGVDYRIKNDRTKSVRITSWNFFHPISHCAADRIEIAANEFINIVNHKSSCFASCISQYRTVNFLTISSDANRKCHVKNRKYSSLDLEIDPSWARKRFLFECFS